MFIDKKDLHISFICSPGPGGQNVNKLATAAQLRFQLSSLPDDMRMRLTKLAGKKITLTGELVIKASRFRTQEKNKQDALARLQALLQQVATVPKSRKKTKPTFAAKQRRLTDKKLQARNKSLRRNKINEDS